MGTASRDHLEKIKIKKFEVPVYDFDHLEIKVKGLTFKSDRTFVDI